MNSEARSQWTPQAQQWEAPQQQWGARPQQWGLPSYQAPPPPKKKRHFVRWTVLGLIAIVVFAGIASAASNANKSSPANNQTTNASTTAAAVSAWWSSVQPEWQALEADEADSGSAAKAQDFVGMSAACQKMTSDAQALLAKGAAPVPALDSPWQAAIRDYAKSGSECTHGIAQDDPSLIDQSITDQAAASGELNQATNVVNSLAGKS